MVLNCPGPLRFINFDFEGNIKYTWLVPRELPDGYLEVHTFSVDAERNLYGGDNQYGRTQKFVPKPGADSELLIESPWVGNEFLCTTILVITPIKIALSINTKGMHFKITVGKLSWHKPGVFDISFKIEIDKPQWSRAVQYHSRDWYRPRGKNLRIG
jgi:hypothetical protein